MKPENYINLLKNLYNKDINLIKSTSLNKTFLHTCCQTAKRDQPKFLTTFMDYLIKWNKYEIYNIFKTFENKNFIYTTLPLSDSTLVYMTTQYISSTLYVVI